MKQINSLRPGMLSCALVVGYLVVAGMASSLQAQTDYGKRGATRSLTIGPTIQVGASMTIDPPELFKVAPIFAYRTGTDISFPLTPVIGSTLSLGLDSRGTKLRNHEVSEDYSITRVNYFSITPGFTFSAFWLGLNIGLPISAGNTRKSGPNATETESDFSDAQLEDVSLLLEPRLGAIIPLLEDKTGWLGLTITAGYSLNELSDRPESVTSNDQAGDFHMVSGHLGLTYQFAIPGTARK